LATEQDAESWPLQGPRALYATVKIAMEHEALQAHRAGLPLVVVNPSLCLGEYDAHPFSGRAILAYAKHRLPVYVDHTFNAVYTGDVGVGHVRAAERGGLGERYLLTGRTIALKEFADIVASCAGVAPPRWRVPYPLVLAAAHASEAVAWATQTQPLVPRQAVHSMRTGQWLDGTKARRALELPQTTVEEAVERAVRWFRRHRYL
jgi:dihydroflavonol-4-reductase